MYIYGFCYKYSHGYSHRYSNEYNHRHSQDISTVNFVAKANIPRDPERLVFSTETIVKKYKNRYAHCVHDLRCGIDLG